MMRPDFDPLDHLLADDAAATDIVPSAGFTDAVMDAVKRSMYGATADPVPVAPRGALVGGSRDPHGDRRGHSGAAALT